MNSLAKMLLAGAVSVLLSGCDLELNLGGSGGARLEDQTRYGEPSSSTLNAETSVALGATLPLSIACVGCEEEPWNVVVENPHILQLHQQDGTHLEVTGKHLGQTRLVLDSGADVLETNVEVKAIASSHIRFYPWEPGLGLPPELWSGGIAIFPETNLWVGGCHLDESGNPLRGFGAKPWEIIGSTTVSGTIMLYDHADFGIYRSPDVPQHVDRIRLGEDVETEIQTVHFDEANSLEVYVGRSLFEVDGGTLVAAEGERVESESFAPIHGIVRTADGRYIAGSGQHTLELVHAETGDSLLTEENGEELERILESGRAGLLADNLPKGVDIPARATYGELSIVFNLHIPSELPDEQPLTP